MPTNHLLIRLVWLLSFTTAGWEGFGQRVGPDKLIIDGKLSWVDFSGPVDAHSPYSASTYWRISYRYRVQRIADDRLRLAVWVGTYLRGESWVAPMQKTAALLEHEQGHFDIARIHAAQFKKSLLTNSLDKRTYAHQIALLFEATLTDARRMDQRYDAETDHSRNRLAQQQWNQKLNRLLIVSSP